MLENFTYYDTLKVDSSQAFATMSTEFFIKAEPDTTQLTTDEEFAKRKQQNKKQLVTFSRIEDGHCQSTRITPGLYMDLRLLVAVTRLFPKSKTALRFNQDFANYQVCLDKGYLEALGSEDQPFGYLAHKGLRVLSDTPTSSLLWNALQDGKVFHVFNTTLNHVLKAHFKTEGQAIFLDKLLYDLKTTLIRECGHTEDFCHVFSRPHHGDVQVPEYQNVKEPKKFYTEDFIKPVRNFGILLEIMAFDDLYALVAYYIEETNAIVTAEPINN